MSLNTIETARSLSKGPITKEKTQNFLDYIDSNFPNGWEQNSEIRTIVIDFQGKLHNNQEQWAQDAFTAIEASRDQRGVLASSIRPVLRPNTDSINETPELATAKSKLSDIGETPESAALVFEEITNKTPTEAHIREYQEEHRLGIDGIIGIKTFGELQGKRLQQRLNADIRNNSEINTELQGDIIDWFEYANLNAVDAMFLRRILQIRKGELQKTENYDVLYKDFFDQISKYETVSNESEEGQATQAEVEKELHRPDADGRSLYRKLTDSYENGTLAEDIGDFATSPLVIFALAAGFVFGMIPGVNNTVATNTWWKRLLIGGLAVMNGDSIKDIASDLSGGFDTARSAVLTGSGDIADRIATERSRQGSELNIAFPDAGLLESVNEHFISSPELGNIDQANIPTYIAALESGNGIPDFLQSITIDGTILSTEQIIAYLRSMQVAGQNHEGNKIIDFLTTRSQLELTGGTVLGISLLALSLTPYGRLAKLGIGVGASMIGYESAGELWESLKANNSFFQRFEPRINNLYREIGDESTRNIVMEIASSETSIENKITRLKEIRSTNPDTSNAINQIVDLLIGFEVESESEILKRVQEAKDGEAIIAQLESTKTLVSENVTNEAERARLIGVIEASIIAIREKSNELYGQEIESSLSEIKSQISDKNAEIGRLNATVETLESEILTATAEDIVAKQQELSEISGEIADLRGEIILLTPLRQAAEVSLADHEVEASGELINIIENYFRETIKAAIDSQGLVFAMENNASSIFLHMESLDSIVEKIDLAEDTSVKTVLESQIENTRALIEGYSNQYKSQLESEEIITTESVSTENIDFSDEETINEISRIIERETNQNRLKAIKIFGIISHANINVQEIYKGEFERQLSENQVEIESTPIQELYVLKRLIEKRDILKVSYVSLFDSVYQGSDLKNILSQKKAELNTTIFENIQFSENDIGAEYLNNFYNALSEPDKSFIQNELQNINFGEFMASLEALSGEGFVNYESPDGSSQTVSQDSKEIASSIFEGINFEINFLSE